jgi:hypothetical protein
MARVQLFLSTVSAEFLSYRERLRHQLTRPDVEVKVQEDFIVTGTETLEMLDAYIQSCDGVIHLVGDMTGAMAMAPSVAAIAQKYPELASRFPLAEFLQPDGPSLSYTQWEAWLALLHHKPLFIATAKAETPRDAKYVPEESQQALQQAHLSRLNSVERFAGCSFASQDDLAVQVLRSFVLDLLVQAGLTRRPLTLPFASIGPLFKGRAALIEQLEDATRPVALIGQDPPCHRARLEASGPLQRRAPDQRREPGSPQSQPGGPLRRQRPGSPRAERHRRSRSAPVGAPLAPGQPWLVADRGQRRHHRGGG